MLQTIKQRVLNAIPPTVLFLALFFSILYLILSISYHFLGPIVAIHSRFEANTQIRRACS